ncbi:MAG: 16S rRNA (cytidine(1402)-2'-O)-methyltransferase [Myxococcales bacterium]|nr:16S rRNA (cytidine(1402)-2'-O)-methyltransferase [Myxococcales bacterium]
MGGTLYLVATPIGNLADITHRGVSTLRSVSFVAAEDTRHSRKLLEAYGISKELVSLPAFAERERAGAILERVERGEDCAVVTDAGSPGISDPGEKLVGEAIARGIRVVPVPGPSALVAALSASGLPAGRFHFLGFLPRKGPERRALMEEAGALSATLVIYESPRRLGETLEDLLEELGDRRACVARELTKVHEELVRGRLSDLAGRYRGAEVLGEVVLLLEGRAGKARWSEEEVRGALEKGLGAGERLKPLSTEIAKRAGWTSGEVYKLGTQLARRR